MDTTIFSSIITTIIAIVGGIFIAKYYGKKQLMDVESIIKKLHTISLSDEYHLTYILANQIKKSGYKPDFIVTISPGGGMLGEWLSVKFLGTLKKPIPVYNLWIDVKRDSKGRHLETPIASKFEPTRTCSANTKILLVNDTSRTGSTLKIAKETLEETFSDCGCEIKIAVLFRSTDANKPHPDFYVEETSHKIRFEWKDKSRY